ncbi:MAG: EVE domain-containing protein [Polyangiaceae bacterium]|nr:EVE domain-containing protein [Polyangiaceae bacterium]
MVGVFRYRHGEDALHLLVIDWNARKPGNHYLVVFGDPGGVPLMESHKVADGKLLWRYAPKSRDGRNEERQEQFAGVMGSVDVELPLPTGPTDVSALLDAVVKLVEARKAARDVGADDQGEAPVAAVAWIFQANPRYFDLAAALGTLNELQWRVNQHLDRIKPGHRVFLWQSGKNGGVLALGTILTAPATLAPMQQEQPFVLDAEALPPTPMLGVRVRIDEVLDEPLDRETLREDPRLASLGFLRASQGTNFPVTDAELGALLDLASGSRPPRTVKIAPGEEGRYWDDCLSGGYICVGWDEVGDLHQYRDKHAFRDVFRKHFRYGGNEPTVAKKSNELWTLRELRPGDLIVANRGMSEVLGVGRVLEPGYAWNAKRPEYKHTVRVEWDTSSARRIPKQPYWGVVTVCDVPVELFSAIISKPKAEEPGPAASTTFAKLCASLQEAGLSYSEEVVSAYLLALQAKRFVIVTGISGTGKTQLAITVAEQLGSGARRKTIAEIPKTATRFIVQPYSLKYNRLVLPRALAAELGLTEAGAQWSPSEIEVVWPGGKEQLSAGTYKNASTLLFKGPFRRWFQTTFSIGDPFYVDLEEVSEGGGQRLRFGVPKKVEREVEEPPRVAVVAVRPDWTDNRGLLGYYNPILQQYVTTEFLRLLLRARDEAQAAKRENRTPEPYFVILDEMNLARVEHYFSDFLSAMESGKEMDLHDDDDVESGEKSDADPIPKRLGVPPNLFFTGTVNVDETTYMFSPKVLDRAYVLELNLVDLAGFSATGVAGEGEGQARFACTDMPQPLRAERPPRSEDWEELGTLLEGQLRRVVIDLHRLLEAHSRHFGYRVANEIGRFVALASEQSTGGADTAEILWAALDLAVLFKVLPKLHGTQQELEELLASLFTFAATIDFDASVKPESAYAGWSVDRDRLVADPESGHTRPWLPRTAAKLLRMARRLERQGFTSFIE